MKRPLAQELAELEATDPDVKAAAEQYDEMMWRLTHKDDVANPFRDDYLIRPPRKGTS